MLAMLLHIVSLKVVDDGKVVNVAAAGRDITMLVALILFAELLNKLLCISKNEKRLDKISLKDELTGLPNIGNCGLARAKHLTVE